ncbi:hypothetical protein J421_4957 (plasmid) [Gemmatirosa kalamazoonensis]|uniref:Uncharacterized protein n=1 Tax=Gemmatirosa kalamazoonensis TaxID=861299 RepID=W0RPS2_9BACT|nr:TonB-dependent receptor [Gemmatirosa kalamazoonensis]AHG92492.1 hypothetical protein J421_4957 [Gemmatirosa kalamazoonensis]
MSSRHLLGAAIVAAAIPALAPHRLAAQQVDVIRGRVTGQDRQPVENAQVTVTSISGNVNRTARTDKNGRFTVTFPNGDGDYFVTFAAIGFAQKRFEVKRVADEDFLLADATLQPAATQLDAVKVTAQRDRVNRNDAQPTDISGSEKRVDNSAVPATQMGDLAAMASSLPGVTPVPGADGDPAGFSVLGLSSDQNQTSLNGMAGMSGNNIPRDAAISTSLGTSNYDVSVGGFSGARFNLRAGSGSNYVQRAGSLFGTTPQLQMTDAAARALGQQTTNVSLSGRTSGPMVFNKAFYNVSYQLGRSASDLQTLLNTDAVGLTASGISPDSAQRLMSILGAVHVPTVVGKLPQSRLNDQGSVLGSFDVTPPSSSSGQSFNVTFNGGWNRQTPAFASATETPAHSGDRTNWNVGVQGRHSSYIKNIILSETSFGVSGSRSSANPYLDLPSGSVLVNSSFVDGTNGVRFLSFGGSPSMSTSQTSNNVGLTNQLSWFSSNNKHRLKLATELRRDGYAQDQSQNLLGSFSFNSLADIEANRPSSFSRQLSDRTRSGAGYVGAVSLGDSYKRTPNFQLQYGVRVDANHFDRAPTLNPDVEKTFSVRNDAVPNRVYVSPRVGFSWQYGKASQIGAFEGAFRGPRAVIRGGVGLFQNTPGAQLIGQAVDLTGLPSGLQQITCVGPAAPVPDWNLYASNPAAIPTRCADGSTGSVFANAAPNVTLFAKSWAAPRSVRSNLNWSGPVLSNRFSLSVDGTYSLNLNQSGFVDRNFAGVQRFALGDEGGRPVYVQPTSIVPQTGVIAAADARVSPLFQRVTEQRSDLRSETKQLSLSVSPLTFNTKLSWSLSYTLQDVRERYNGFQSAAGDPFVQAWSAGAGSPRHQFTYSLGYNAFDVVRFSWFGNVRSGSRFTPQIAGDINGDGYSNDRAFVFDPARTTDPAVKAGMQSLLASGSGIAKDCLGSQMGSVAARNSCTGPWSHLANLSVSFNPLKVRMPQRAVLSFSVSNPLGLADRALHGEDNLHGWGQMTFVDPALLYVRGFDPVAKRYKYEVNQRFGATNPQFQQFRQPVTVTAQLRFDLGPTREKQNLVQMLDRGRRKNHEGSKMQESLLRAMYSQTGGIMNPIEQVLRQADTLKLTGPQADSVATMNRWYKIRLDSIWSPVAKVLGNLPDAYDEGEAYQQYITARRASVDLLTKLAPDIKGLLTAEQRRKLPAFIASYLDPRYLASIRSGTAGAGMGGGPMMIMGGGPIMMGGGGGGGDRVIIR